YIKKAISSKLIDEHSEDYKRAIEFRRKVSNNVIVDHFGNRDEVKSCTILALNKFAAYPDIAGWVRGTVENG
ncbi:hypothetical protein, partial [Klebsiella pneumoniae]|uniref:hypothetical protein n=1 Tax=Klebsiella pneumoniae TaxID=573 RepID=UPI0013D5DAFB